MRNSGSEWNNIYEDVPLERIPWHSERPPLSLVRNAKTAEKGRALDLCSGAGVNSVYLAKQGFKVTGIEISPIAVNIARERAMEKGVNVDFKVGDVLNLKERSAYDFAFDRGCFHHMPKKDRRLFAQNVYQSLKEGGKFQLMVFSPKNMFDKSVTRREVRKTFSRHFSINQILEETHTQPDGLRVFFYTFLMNRK